MQEVLAALGPSVCKGRGASADMEQFAKLSFTDLSPGEQSVVLLMRALVGRPAVVFLDEAWSGMDEGMVHAAKAYLRDGDALSDGQACVVISHWEEEVPWGPEQGIQRFRLDGGKGEQIFPVPE